MSLLTLLVAIGKELLPFLKEALLEGQPFRVWVRRNWLTFAWLVVMAIMTVCISHLVDQIRILQREERRTVEYTQTLHGSVQNIADGVAFMRDSNARLRLRNQELQSRLSASETANDALEVEVARLKHEASKPPRRSTRTAPRRSPSPEPKPPEPVEPEPKPSVMDRIKRIFTRDK